MSTTSEISQTSTDSHGKGKLNNGDWICSDAQCGNVNFSRRKTCNRCGAEKVDLTSSSKKKLGTEIGKAAAEKSKGLFSADDWQCNKCGNVNWARRQQCNMCNAPKFGDVEERTGLGGGYNDRGVVEYNRRADSDDEYDEFGRRKRRRRATDDERSDDSSNRDMKETEQLYKEKMTNYKKHTKSRRNDNVSNSDRDRARQRNAEPLNSTNKKDKISLNDEDDDDEEDDDDGDLSKYDLSDWGDLAPAPVIRKRDTSPGERRSRSPRR